MFAFSTRNLKTKKRIKLGVIFANDRLKWWMYKYQGEFAIVTKYPGGHLEFILGSGL